MGELYLKIGDVQMWPPSRSYYYVKVYWNGVKYKTSSRFFTLVYNEEFYLPVRENQNKNTKLYIEIWQSHIFNWRVGYTHVLYKDILNGDYTSKEIRLTACALRANVKVSLYPLKRSSDELFSEIAKRFPHIPEAQIREAISMYKTKQQIIEHLTKVPYTQNNQNNNYIINRPIPPSNDMVYNMPNYNTQNQLAQPFVTGTPNYTYNNPVIPTMTNQVFNHPSHSTMMAVNQGSFNNGGTASPYPDIYLYRSPENQKKALLIGVNYFGTKYELKGCSNDTLRMKTLLISKYGFYDSSLTMLRLIDNSDDPKYRPTKKNILAAMSWLTADNKRGDVFFFLFSGHGSQQKDFKNVEADGYNETILPSDHLVAGHIIDDDIQRYLVQPLQNGVKLVAVMDCCQSGTSLDLAYEYKIKKKKWKELKNPFHVVCDVNQFSSCKDKEKSYEVHNNINAPGGSLVNALIHVLNSSASLTYEYLLNSLCDYVRQHNKEQSVSFMSSQRFSISHRLFDFDNILENKNTHLGQIMNYIPSKKKK